MRTNSRLRKIRIIVQPRNEGSVPVYGVVLPSNLKHWVGVNVTIRESGNAIILESGAKPFPMPKTQLRDFSVKIEDVWI